MKKKTEKSDDLRDDYSPSLIRTGVRGKYASGTNIVLLAPDVAAAFPNADAVNEALRMLVRVAQRSGTHTS